MTRGMAQNTAFMPETNQRIDNGSGPGGFWLVLSKPSQKRALLARSNPVFVTLSFSTSLNDSAASGITGRALAYAGETNHESSKAVSFSRLKAFAARVFLEPVVWPQAQPFSISLGVQCSRAAHPYSPDSDSPPIDDDEDLLEAC